MDRLIGTSVAIQKYGPRIGGGERRFCVFMNCFKNPSSSARHKFFAYTRPAAIALRKWAIALRAIVFGAAREIEYPPANPAPVIQCRQRLHQRLKIVTARSRFAAIQLVDVDMFDVSPVAPNHVGDVRSVSSIALCESNIVRTAGLPNLLHDRNRVGQPVDDVTLIVREALPPGCAHSGFRPAPPPCPVPR